MTVEAPTSKGVSLGVTLLSFNIAYRVYKLVLDINYGRAVRRGSNSGRRLPHDNWLIYCKSCY